MKKKPDINHQAWSQSMIGFIREKGLEQELADWCGGWRCPIPEVAQWRYEIQHGPDGQADYAWVYDGDGNLVCTAKTHHAIAIVARAAPSPSSAGTEDAEYHTLLARCINERDELRSEVATLKVQLEMKDEALNLQDAEISRLTNVAQGWRDISTAPMDGTPMLLCRWEGECDVLPVTSGFWSRLSDGWFSEMSGHKCNPTHWMPLPTDGLPVSSTDRGGA